MGIHAFSAVMRFPYEISSVLLHNFLMRFFFLMRIHAFLLHNFLMRFAYEISCFLALMRFHEIC
jgi:hypothetical protein